MQIPKNSSANLLSYYPSDNRTRKTVVKGIITKTRYYLGDYELYKRTVSGATDFQRQTTTLSDGEKVFARIEQLDSEAPVVRYQFDNHLGSASLELDSVAAIISYEEYHPFGSTSYRSGKTETEVSLKRYKYNGKERDDETGLYYYGARYYAAWLGRFVSVDPLAHQTPTWNPYHYCHNNPVNLVDPSGMSAEGPDDPPVVAKNSAPQDSKDNWTLQEGKAKDWYPKREDLTIYENNGVNILEQDVSTNDDLEATAYFYQKGEKWIPFEPQKSTFTEDVHSIVEPVLYAAVGFAGVQAFGVVEGVVEGGKIAGPYIAQASIKTASVIAEEVSLAYESAQGFVAMNPVATRALAEAVIGYSLKGPDHIELPGNVSVISETIKVVSTLNSNKEFFKEGFVDAQEYIQDFFNGKKMIQEENSMSIPYK